MSRIEQTFKRTRGERRPALIPFITAGDPDLQTTEDLVLKMAESGADIIELGVPFSDPLADGPTIQASSMRALKSGTSLMKIFQMVERLNKVDTPLVLMTYFNPVLKYGLKEFSVDCRRCGIDGVIIPDLPPEEAAPWVKEARIVDLDTIFLTAPTSPPERIRSVNQRSRGFVYHVSAAGVTGTRKELPETLESDVRRVKENAEKPVAVGFGISTPKQAKEAGRFADGIIVGSAIVRIMADSPNPSEMIGRVGEFVCSLKEVLKPSRRHPGKLGAIL
jgi:tryptophan synthase alpha chain